MTAPILIRPVIMCGGSGTRLWPLSTSEKPKQFHALTSDRSLFAETIDRFETSSADGVAFTAPFVIAGRGHAAAIGEETSTYGLTIAETLLEPAPRNTAPVAAVAALAAADRKDEALVLLTPADHHVAAPAAFHAAIEAAAPAARDGRIVTFGLKPDHPATGYGYIRRGAPLGEIFAVDAFVEKPDADTAARYLSDGGYDWNAGVFLFRPDVLLAEMERLCPAILAAAQAAYDRSAPDAGQRMLDAAAFDGCPSDSIDYAVMEKTDKAAVAPADIGWSDVGSFDALWRLKAASDAENVLLGDAHAPGSAGCYVATTGPKVAVLGVEDLVVVATQEGVVIAPKSDPAAIGAFAKSLKKT